MENKAAIIFQFTVMAIIAGVLFYGFIVTQTWNEIALGALIGSFMGLPQAFNTEKK